MWVLIGTLFMLVNSVVVLSCELGDQEKVKGEEKMKRKPMAKEGKYKWRLPCSSTLSDHTQLCTVGYLNICRYCVAVKPMWCHLCQWRHLLFLSGVKRQDIPIVILKYTKDSHSKNDSMCKRQPHLPSVDFIEFRSLGTGYSFPGKNNTFHEISGRL